MINLLNPVLEAKTKIFLYRFRFLSLYVLIGFISIIIEFFIRTYLISKNINEDFSTFCAIFFGIIFAFLANVKFNFKISKNKRNRSLFYFMIIASFSGLLQYFLKENVGFTNKDYELNRLIISSTVFIFAYALHRKFSFRDFKKVGVAIYANGVEDLKNIHDKIGFFPDFIHVDIVDNSMSDNAEDVKTYKLETMKAYWPNTQIQTHIMSLKPEEWIDQILTYSDVVYIHEESKKDIRSLFKKIKNSGKKAGLALLMSTEINEIIELIKEADYVLLLTIPKPGSSGQKFDPGALEKIHQLNSLKFRSNFTLCIDGGVDETIINMLQAENIVSGSSVLKNNNPKQQIMRLQTLGRYQ